MPRVVDISPAYRTDQWLRSQLPAISGKAPGAAPGSASRSLSGRWRPTRPRWPALLDDLEAEHADLEALLEPLDEASWELPTPAEGWAVRDQVSHLAFFDDAATMAIVDPPPSPSRPRRPWRPRAIPWRSTCARGRAMAGP